MKTGLKSIFLVISTFVAVSCSNQNLNTYKDIIPLPVELVKSKGSFTFEDGMSVYINNECLSPAFSLLQDFTGKTFNLSSDSNSSVINISIEDDMTKEGGYNISVKKGSLIIKASDYNGVVSAISTIRQLLPVNENNDCCIPCVEINDYHEYQWRGMHLDVSRHFYTKEEVMKLLDLMSLYKFNKFHWHLTDDQGWRIEIKKYPLLTEKGAWRKFNDQDRTCMRLERDDHNPDYRIPEDKISIIEGDTIYGGFYSQEDIKDVVKYAADRGIDVIPEIDMPGHFLAAINQYPEVACNGLIGWGEVFSSPICVGKDSTLEFCKNIWREVFQLFPYEYAHLGGDEVEKGNWKKCKDCQSRIKKEGLHSVEELQAWFVREMETFFNQNGKKMIGWDEVVEDGLSDKSVISWWRSWCPDAVAKATEQGMKAIICPNSHLYFDYEQKPDYLQRIYDMNVIPEGLSDEQKKLVWGVQCNIWTEWIPTMDRLEYMVFPRMMAVSEIGWCNKSRLDDFKGFERRVKEHFNRMNKMDVNYRIPDLTGFYDKNVFVDKGIFKIDSNIDGVAVIRYTTDGSIPTLESKQYTEPLTITENTVIKFRAFRPDGSFGKLYIAVFNKEDYSPAVEVEKIPERGLNVSLYDFTGNKCSDIAVLSPENSYVSANIEYPEGKKGNIAMVCNGYLDIPADGVYTFSLLSDDGSILKIDDEILIDNDGLHSPAEKNAQKALKKGLHKLDLSYFDYYGGVITLYVINDKGEKTVIPSEWLKH